MTENQRFLKIALGLALFTIFYNIPEGIISAYFGLEDESLALFGFGSDSFIEVISGIGIAHMVMRIQKNRNSKRDNFERTALKITGFAFYILVFVLVTTSIYNIWVGHKPVTTFWGIVISIISILVMWLLVIGKRKVGKKLDSDPILADANCTLGYCQVYCVNSLFSNSLKKGRFFGTFPTGFDLQFNSIFKLIKAKRV